MKFADNNALINVIDFFSFFVNKNYHFKMIFESSLIDFESIKERLLMNKIDNIVDEMKRIVAYVRIRVIKIDKIMIAQVNKHRKFIKYEIKKYVWLNRRNIKTIKSSNKLNDKYLKFYLITKKKNRVYELKLFENVQIHSMFHFWLLRKNSQNSLSSQQNDSSRSLIFEKNFEWQIDDIVDFKYKRHRLQYRIKWTKFSIHDRRWYYVDNDEFHNV